MLPILFICLQKVHKSIPNQLETKGLLHVWFGVQHTQTRVGCHSYKLLTSQHASMHVGYQTKHMLTSSVTCAEQIKEIRTKTVIHIGPRNITICNTYLLFS